MTAFLFIPQTGDARLGRRVDFANIGSLFAEADEPSPRDRSRGARVWLMLLVLLGIIGDTFLVAHPDALADGFTTTLPQGTHRAVNS